MAIIVPADGKALIDNKAHDDVTKWKYFPLTGEFPSQRQVTGSFDVFFDLRLNKWFGTQSRRWWFETPHYDVTVMQLKQDGMREWLFFSDFEWVQYVCWLVDWLIN